MSGLFRIVCTNGLITCDGGEMQRIAHKGDIVSNVIEGAYTIIDHAQDVAARADDMRAITLRGDEQLALAEAALTLRYTDKDEQGNVKKAPIEATDLLRSHRMADNEHTLWHSFNRIQENVVNGGSRYTHRAATGRRTMRETRPVNSIDGNVTLNRALWTLATRMQELKAA